MDLYKIGSILKKKVFLVMFVEQFRRSTVAFRVKPLIRLFLIEYNKKKKKNVNDAITY